MTKKLEVVRGSGNVFADLGLANADIEHERVKDTHKMQPATPTPPVRDGPGEGLRYHHNQTAPCDAGTAGT